MTPPDFSPVALATAHFACEFDRRTGFLRQVRVDGIEMVRAIYGAVRDHRWGTLPVTVANVRWKTDHDGFDLSFEGDCRDDEGAHFQWHGAIRGQGRTLEYTFDGQARTAFRRNRIGLCVLHPIAGCAGQSCRVLSSDGVWRAGAFPRYIAPHQPFRDVRALAWSPAPGLDAEIRFEGEIFETEDQRNWTDASFKTYGTPLDLPFPVGVARDEAVRQRVEFKFSRQPVFRVAVKPAASEIELVPGDPVGLPPLGLGVASHGQELEAREATLLKRLRLSHLRVDLRFPDARWTEAWARAQADAAALGAGLHCALFWRGDCAAELNRFVELALHAAAPVTLCLLMDASTGADAFAAAAAGKLSALGAPVAVGTDANFAELNRARPPAGSLACYSINPQAHAFDDLSLVENLAAQPETVAAAAAFGAHGVAVSPVTLLPRPPASLAPQNRNVPINGFPPGVDGRQRTLFAAAWTLGSLARLAPLPGVQSLTYYETTGWRGVIERTAGSPCPERFASAPGEVFPVYHLFADLADCHSVQPVRASDASQVAALGLLTSSGGHRVLLANLRPQKQTARLRTDAVRAAVRVLDEARLPLARTRPESFCALAGDILPVRAGILEITLPPYAMARVDLFS